MDAQSFIREINALIAQEKTKQEERLTKGECFNIFQIMGLASDEVHTHSALIAELLNPEGMHGCGDVFLQLFINNIPSFKDFDFDFSHAKTCVEYYIGEITPDYEEGGRIDILVESQNKAIVIENKIYAEDQQKQLLRYYNFAQKKFPRNYKLIYLTLFGKEPSAESTTDILSKDNYLCISYTDEIMKWLDDCITIVKNKPLIEAVLIQYKKTLDYLTNRTVMSEETTKELTKKILDNTEYIKNLNAFTYAIEVSKKELVEQFWLRLFQVMQTKYGDKLHIVQIEGEKFTRLASNESAIKKAASDFKFSSQRSRYNYRFGLSVPIKEIKNQRLIAGIIIDSAITFRIYAEDMHDNHIPVDNSIEEFKQIQEQLGSCAFPEISGWPLNIYLCVKRPVNGSRKWNFAEMNDEALENLSNMDDNIKSLLQEFDDYTKEIVNRIK